MIQADDVTGGVANHLIGSLVGIYLGHLRTLWDLIGKKKTNQQPKLNVSENVVYPANGISLNIMIVF